MTKKILLNMVQCRKCKQVLISQRTHEFRSCHCGTFVDGGREYLRRGARDMADIRELSVYEEDNEFRLFEEGEE